MALWLTGGIRPGWYLEVTWCMNAFYRILGKWSWGSAWMHPVTGNSPPSKEPKHFWAFAIMWKSLLPSDNLPPGTFGLWLCHLLLSRARVQDRLPYLQCNYVGVATLSSSCISTAQVSITPGIQWPSVCQWLQDLKFQALSKIWTQILNCLSNTPTAIPHGHPHSGCTPIWTCDLVPTTFKHSAMEDASYPVSNWPSTFILSPQTSR